MGNVSLLFGGVALFLNSLVLFGKIDMKSAGVFSLFTGLLQTFIATWLLIGASPAEQFGTASIYLFAFTYLYVGVTFLFDLDGRGVGYFSLFVAVAAIFYTIVTASQGDVMGSVTWAFWAFLWGLFFMGMGLGHANEMMTAHVALVLAWLTLIVPALVSLAGLTGPIYVNMWWAAALTTIVYFVVVYVKQRRVVPMTKVD